MFFLRIIYRKSVAVQGMPFPTKTNEINKAIVSSWHNFQVPTSSAWGAPCNTLAGNTNALGFQARRAFADCVDGQNSDVLGSPRWRAGVSKAVLPSAAAPLAAFSGKSHVLTPEYSVTERRGHWGAEQYGWINLKSPLCCPSISAQPSVRAGI